jgi:drug/metabolite transporter (DMT)-like permease
MSATSIIAASAGGIALGTLGVELFPTETRSTSNGLLGVLAVLGSALGFVLTGLLARSRGELGRAIAVCGFASLFAAIFLVPLLPESHARRLDDVSPTVSRPPDEYGPQT